MERPVVFGNHDHLVGVVTEAEHPAGNSEVAVILMTAGMLHHVGPFRLHVDLARQLASKGIRSLRFDLSGIGESLGVGSAGSSIDRAAAETGAAMDWMRENGGSRKFILFGLCSGADDSMHTAVNDDRVHGFVAIDGCGYRTKRFHWYRLIRHYVPRLLTPKKWFQFVKRILSANETPPSTLQAGSDVREFPDREEAVKQFQTLADRQTRMHFVYTGGISEYYNYQQQFFEMLPEVDWQQTASTTFFPHMDHVALLCEDRNQLVSHVVSEIASIVESITNSAEATDKPAGMPSLNSWPVISPNATV
tara:strand:+ start:142999 stop:143916 length:918 start_codon:yes stop_codon:yes gene_type:complete